MNPEYEFALCVIWVMAVSSAGCLAWMAATQALGWRRWPLLAFLNFGLVFVINVTAIVASL